MYKPNFFFSIRKKVIRVFCLARTLFFDCVYIVCKTFNGPWKRRAPSYENFVVGRDLLEL